MRADRGRAAARCARGREQRPKAAAQLAESGKGAIELGDLVTHELEDDSLQVLKQKYDVGTMPSVRVVRPDGTIAARVDGLVGVPEFLAALAKGRTGSLAQR